MPELPEVETVRRGGWPAEVAWIAVAIASAVIAYLALRTLALEGMVLGGVGALTGAALSLGISLMLYVVPVNMPPPPGRSSPASCPIGRR